MPSKKKARGKGPRAAKSRKAKEESGAVNGIDSEMQQLQIGNNNKNTSKDDDEDALLEEAINLATAEKEELEAVAKNDKANISEECYHGFDPTPTSHVCFSFMQSFYEEFNACCAESDPYMIHLFEHIYEATKTKYAEVWNDPDMVQRVASHFIIHGTNEIILEGNYYVAAYSAVFSSFFEQLAATEICTNENQGDPFKVFLLLCDWCKVYELYKGDEHTLVSFFRKRITCNCLDNKYKEVQSIAKIGFCSNPNCILPDKKIARGKMMSCTQCRRSSYCSRECQVAHWPKHKQLCVVAAGMRAAQKLRQKRSRQSRSEDSS